MRNYILAIICCLFYNNLYAQDSNVSNADKFIVEMFRMHMGKTICPPVGDSSLGAVKGNIADYLERRGLSAKSTGEDVAKAIWAVYPCPFSPIRSELKLVDRSELIGYWLFPEVSQKLRYGPKSSANSPAGPLPVKCEVIAYLPDGESRNAIIAGVPECPYKSIDDVEVIRKFPRVSSWVFLGDGRLKINRIDVDNHVEEWEVYLVQKNFSVYGVNFSEGDLLAYLRKSPGNDVGASGQFRHLRKLAALGVK